MRAPVLKPIRSESKSVLVKINDLLQKEPSTDSKIIIMEEEDLKKLIVNVITEMDDSFVRKSDLKRELELALQDMVRGQIAERKPNDVVRKKSKSNGRTR